MDYRRLTQEENFTNTKMLFPPPFQQDLNKKWKIRNRWKYGYKKNMKKGVDTICINL